MNQFEQKPMMKGAEYDPGKVLSQNLEKIKAEHPELGKNVEVTIRYARHGEKTPEGALSEKGKIEAGELGIAFPEGMDRMVGYGSTLEQGGAQRALDTVKIALENAPEAKIAGLATIERIGKDLDFKALKNSWDLKPYLEVVARGKAEGWASHKTDTVGLNETIENSPKSARETASRFAHLTKFLLDSAFISKNGESDFYPVVTHSPNIESFLKAVLVRKNKDTGEEILGFDKLEEVGGAFRATENMDLSVKTDEDKNINEVVVKFDNTERAKLLEGYDLFIDMDKLNELDKEYDEYE